MKELTKAEEQIMQVLWDLNRAFVKEIIDRLPDPKPAYNTVSTIVRILQDKGFVGHETYGKSHCYYPLVDKDTYTRKFLKNFIGNYFQNSFSQMVSPVFILYFSAYPSETYTPSSGKSVFM